MYSPKRERSDLSQIMKESREFRIQPQMESNPGSSKVTHSHESTRNVMTYASRESNNPS